MRPETKWLFTMLTALALAQSSAWSQEPFPSKPIKLVVSFPAGGAPDTMARVYGEKLKEFVNQPVIVDNRPGATGTIGADFVAKSPGDGYTLLVSSSALVVNAWVMKQPFDLQKDLLPIVRTAVTSYVMTVSPLLPVRDFDEFLIYARQNPGKVACGTYGLASPPHLHIELLKKAAGIEIVHVPYKTYMQALTDLLSGQLQCSIDPPTIPLPHIQSGRVKAIAHTGNGPMGGSPLLRDLTPIGKLYPTTTVVGWQAIWAPASTPAPIVSRLRSDWSNVIKNPEVGQKIRSFGFEPGGDSVDAFTKDIRDDYERFGRVIRDSNIRLE